MPTLNFVADSTQSTGLNWQSSTTQFPWTTWNPTYSNITVGNGTITARYQQIGKTVNFYWRFLFGSTSAFTGSPATLTLPISPAYVNGLFQDVEIEDSGTAYFSGFGALRSGPVLQLGIINTTGTYSGLNLVSATAPMTWTTNDNIQIRGTYEAA